MSRNPLKIVILGLSITSSWGNGHATTYRGLVRELAARGHRVLFLEREVPWYARNRDLPNPVYARACLYKSVDELKNKFTRAVRDADLVIVGSYVPDGIEIGRWVIETAWGVTAFYDIDTPVTLAALKKRKNTYESAELISPLPAGPSSIGSSASSDLPWRGRCTVPSTRSSIFHSLNMNVGTWATWELIAAIGRPRCSGS
jgi:hypothetical protein